MKTDDLISMLSTNVEPVDRTLVVRRVSIAVAAGSAAAVGLMLGGFGFRADLTTVRAFIFLAFKLAFAIAIVGVTSVYLTRLTRPAGEGRTSLISIAIPFAAVGVLAAASLALACGVMATVQLPITLFIGFSLLRGTAVGALVLLVNRSSICGSFGGTVAAAAASLGLAAGSMVFPKLIDALIQLYGWRGAYLALGGLVALSILPVAAALFRDLPEQFGPGTDAGLPFVKQEPKEVSSFTRRQGTSHGGVLAA